MSNRFTHSVSSRTAAGWSSSGSQRACPARAAVLRTPAQTRTAKHIGLRGPSRGSLLIKPPTTASFMNVQVEELCKKVEESSLKFTKALSKSMP